jgi:hypothetical protein
MPTKSETIMAALKTRLLATGVEVRRNDPVPTDIKVGGLIILRDGEPGEPLTTMSPLFYEYQHRAMIEVMVQKNSGRDEALDAIKAQIGQLIAADRTLGGLCDWIEAYAPENTDIGPEDAVAIKAAEIGVMLCYVTTDPLA